MVTIRLVRSGVRNKPFYRIVACDKKTKAKGIHLDILGWWQPINKKSKVDKSKLDLWIKKGAKVSNAVEKLLN